MRSIMMLALALTACAPQRPAFWQYQDLTEPRVPLAKSLYQCTKENTTVRYSSYGTYLLNTDYTNDELVRACMLARGWSWVR